MFREIIFSAQPHIVPQLQQFPPRSCPLIQLNFSNKMASNLTAANVSVFTPPLSQTQQ